MEHVHESGVPVDHHGHDVHAHGANTDDGANVAKDPVCGMTVTESSPHQVDHAGQRYYFCSAKCQEEFTAEPDKYVASKSAAPAAVAAPAAPAGTIYTCPMHPQIRQITTWQLSDLRHGARAVDAVARRGTQTRSSSTSLGASGGHCR